jgi:hypothetical protein
MCQHQAVTAANGCSSDHVVLVAAGCALVVCNGNSNVIKMIKTQTLVYEVQYSVVLNTSRSICISIYSVVRACHL